MVIQTSSYYQPEEECFVVQAFKHSISQAAKKQERADTVRLSEPCYCWPLLSICWLLLPVLPGCAAACLLPPLRQQGAAAAATANEHRGLTHPPRRGQPRQPESHQQAATEADRLTEGGIFMSAGPRRYKRDIITSPRRAFR